MILHYTRAPKTQIWPISSIFFVFFSTGFQTFHSFFNFLPPGWLPGALGPFSNERSHFSASDGTPKTSVRWNLTRFRTVQSSKFHVLVFLTYVCFAFTSGQMGSVILHGFFHIIIGFPSVPWTYSMAKVGNKDKRPAATWRPAICPFTLPINF